MAIGLAFVDIVGDTSRTEQQVERDMNRVLAEVEDSIDPVEVNAEIDPAAERRLLQDLNAQIADLQSRANDLSVNPNIDEFWRRTGLSDLNRDIALLQAQADSIRVDVDTAGMTADVSESVRDAVRIAEATAPTIELETRVDSDRVSRGLSSIGSAAAGILGPLSSVGTALFGLGSALPAIAGIGSAVAAVAPAAALAAPAILTVVSANAALKIGLLGVGDAVKAAFDPSDPEKYAESLEKLSPNARSFVEALASLKPQLDGLKTEVQDNLFDSLGETMKEVGTGVIPLFRKNLSDTAVSLNIMAQGVLGAAQGLQQSGVLGTALDGASKSLNNLANIPGRVVTALGQIAAAAAPSLDKLTSAAGGVVDSVISKISNAFESGGIQKAIEGAIGQIKMFASVLSDVGHIFANVFTIANQFGGTTLDGIKAITTELRKFSETGTFQDALINLFSTIQLITKTAMPLLGQALAAIGPVIGALMPGLQALVKALGPALSQVIAALAPVLLAAGQAISAIAIAVAPLIGLLGQLIAAVLPALTPLLNAVTLVFQQLAPVITQIVGILSATLIPVITALATQVLPPLLLVFTTFISAVLPIFGTLLTALTPALISLSNAFVKLVEALGPVITAFAALIGPLLAALTPILIPIIEFVGKLATVLANTLAQYITTIVVPALQVVTRLLSGDFSGAWNAAKQVVKGFIDFTVQLFVNLPNILGQLIAQLGTALWNGASAAFGKFRDAAVQKIANDFLPWVANLRFEILDRIGDLGGLLINAGRSVINGFLSGVRSKIGELRNLLGEITDMIPRLKGPASRDAKLLTDNGKLVLDGFMNGIASRVPALRAQLGGITSMVGGTSMGVGDVSMSSVDSGRQASVNSAAALSSGIGGTAQSGEPTIQVFIGQQELTQLVDVRVSAANRTVGRQIQNGMRF